MSINDDIDKEVKLEKPAIILLIASGIIIIASFFAPAIFVKESVFGLDFSKTGEIGDTISGIMNPFLTIAGILLTFLAFYIQFKANRLQRKLVRIELDEQKDQFKRNQIENQFYEMLRLHKENINELQIENINIDFKITGRRVFEYIIKEFELCYYIAKKYFPDQSVNVIINEAYGVFFHGINSEIVKKHEYFKILNDIKISHKLQKYSHLRSFVRNKADIDWDSELSYPILTGYSSKLSHYYRHLFQTVKFIAYQDIKLLSYEEKRKYLRILRAQLSNQEQAMLFYNWLSSFGRQWENEVNKFFTDFRMIHNLYQDLLIPDIELTSIFNLDFNYRKEIDREIDHLFEFQDW